MDRGPGFLKLDSVFFERHPELYDSKHEGLIAKGIAIDPPHGRGMQHVTPMPTPGGSMILNKYVEMAKWAFDFEGAGEGV